jgi:hypothetical protein
MVHLGCCRLRPDPIRLHHFRRLLLALHRFVQTWLLFLLSPVRPSVAMIRPISRYPDLNNGRLHQEAPGERGAMERCPIPRKS